MDHLSNQELEFILERRGLGAPHLTVCRLCRNRLAKRRQRANCISQTQKNLVEDKRFGKQSDHSMAYSCHTNRKLSSMVRIRIHIRRGQVIALLVTLLIGFIAWSGRTILNQLFSPADTTGAELVGIHEWNCFAVQRLEGKIPLIQASEYLLNQLEYVPHLPGATAGLSVKGCWVRPLQEEMVCTYLVGSPEGVFSIIVTKISPESLGMKNEFRLNGHVFSQGSFADCSLLSICIDGYAYCAIGVTSPKCLADLLIGLQEHPAKSLPSSNGPRNIE